jgi:hypothetical protein
MSTTKVVLVSPTPTERHKFVALGVKVGKSNAPSRKSLVSTKEQSGEAKIPCDARK